MAWWSVPGIGWRSFAGLLAYARRHRTSLRRLWSRPGRWEAAGLTASQQAAVKTWQSSQSIDDYWQQLEAADITVTCLGSSDYPPLLAEIDDPPWVLFIKGEWPIKLSLPIAVVGTRRPTLYGRQAAVRLVTELVAAGAGIVSGFMFGIDVLAHQTALRQRGRTVGVLGYGFDRVYPPSFSRVLAEYADQRPNMTFISEYAPFVPARRYTFRQRNRIIAGLSLATLVVEAGVRSGTQITARLAGQYGREVAAVPSPITSPYCAGTANLINQGALLTEDAGRLLTELGVGSGRRLTGSLVFGERAEADEQSAGPEEVSLDLIRLFQDGPLTSEYLSAITNLSITQVNVELTRLELLGVVTRQGSCWSLSTRS